MIGPQALTRLAVYGTLRPGRSNHGQLAALRGEWVRGTVTGRLFEKGWRGYPGLVLAPDGEPVEVDLLSSADLPQHWRRLDAFEGRGYRRVACAVTTTAGVVEACIYVLTSPPGPSPQTRSSARL